ncbi:MAG: hypothetical protein DKM50_09395 [Candidatus Margulisiibacteriota bacterium]|nr:MAG: hypothetical protein A2X43_02285 [Candidatus Margulisbacteria bacterium GWD2_39_127]OGI00903.1 MAG: hypothetical protein A2X42_03160 [Candidatus Margulisbacteria bacterium GWF2_38_17]OGI08758.1 MAG: hypothetical protein A2X41_05415 [Candidatus Margulisbacteria bacterium GWE2_39_32]PZM79469.1 MAG: hypothetical protein DKM50_09395 [Candidatus Margulisiibacteriota bacterium]HAR63477.1 hypothetical protein [Candidatus Margulisiibacteriota bacterium]
MPRKISIDEVEPGMVIAEPVKRPNGAVLLGKGIQLSDAFISKMRMMDILEIIVEGEGQDDIEALLLKVERATVYDDAISNKIIERLQRVFSDVKDNKIMQAIMAIAQKTLIAREKNRLEGDQGNP